MRSTGPSARGAVALAVALGWSPAGLAQWGTTEVHRNTPSPPGRRQVETPTASHPLPVAVGYRVIDDARRQDATPRHVLEQDSSATLIIPAGESAARSVEVVMTAPGGRRARFEASRVDKHFELRFRAVDALVGEIPGEEGYSLFKTSGSEDVLVFDRELRRGAGRGGAPRFGWSVIDETAVNLGTATGIDRFWNYFDGRELLDAGGAHLVRFVARGEGLGPVEGALAIAARSRWMVFSGHYRATNQGFLFGKQVNPETIEGSRWKKHLEVLIFAACYAVEIGGQPLDGKRLVGRGLDGALWWRKMDRGTLLGYRKSAPTRAASRLNRIFLEKVRGIRIPRTDRVRYSRAIVRAWMLANFEIDNAWATAVDAEGNYHFSTNLPIEERLGCGRRAGRHGWTVATRECWEGKVGALIERTRMERKIFGPLKRWANFEKGGHPPTLEEALAADPVVKAAARHGIDLDAGRTKQAIRTWIDYEEHSFYEADSFEHLRVAVGYLVRTEGWDAVTVDRLRSFMLPPRGSSRIPHRYEDYALESTIEMMRDPAARKRLGVEEYFPAPAQPLD